jgi:hypothetical protein
MRLRCAPWLFLADADRLDSAADEASKSKIRPDETEAQFRG